MSRIMQKVRPVDGSTKPMSLVFLAACETAQGQESQPDEAMHVAGALLFSGFGGAVATMWLVSLTRKYSMTSTNRAVGQ
jgi:CHAT domain-containing protein